jgi:type II secretory pathway component GspD/PulD (secretin)
LGVETGPAGDRLRVGSPAALGIVEVRRNEAANLVLFTGSPGDVAAAVTLAELVDVAPRQIEIEVRLLEVNRGKARDLGIDWQQVVREAGPRANWGYDETSTEQHEHTKAWTQRGGDGYPNGSMLATEESARRADAGSIRRMFSAASALDLGDVISFLDESGAASLRQAPRILTVNNRRATILDGQRVTYVARYSSYTNLFRTDSLDTGIRLSVVPSLGESGYLTLQVEAELTSLSPDSYISGSPVKDGQIIENTVVAKSGETILLGGLTRTREEIRHRRFPILGRILPFLFSREVHNMQVMESYVLLTPRVVDLETGLDPRSIERRLELDPPSAPASGE